MLFAPTLLKTPWVQARGRAVVSLLARHAHIIRKLCGFTAANVRSFTLIDAAIIRLLGELP